jgi:hypothetical protein
MLLSSVACADDDETGDRPVDRPVDRPESEVLASDDVAPAATTTELAMARSGNDGNLPLDLALDLFASIYGPIPGGTDRFDAVRPGDGSLALRSLAAHAEELDADQRQTLDEARAPTGTSSEDSGVGEGAAVAPGDLALAASSGQAGDDPVGARFQELAEEAASDIADRLGRPLAAALEVDAVPASTFRRRGVLGDAAPVRTGLVVWSGAHDACRVRIKRTAREVAATIAHEVFHCFQFEMAALAEVGRAQDWIVEGSAEWAAATLRGSDDTVAGNYDDWLVTEGSLFDLDYAAVGYFWTIETLGVDPWSIIPLMIVTRGPAAVGTSGLDPADVAARMATGPARRSLDGLDVDGTWDLTPESVPRHGLRDTADVAPASPLTVGDAARGAFSRLPVQRIGFEGTGIDIEADGSVGAVQLVGGDLLTFTGSFRTRICAPEDEGGDGPVELLLVLARTNPGPLSYTVSTSDAGCGLPGRWGVDEPEDSAADFEGSVLEIREGSEGPEPALFTGSQVAPATDCPLWGDLLLDATTDPASRPRLAPPAGAAVTEAWTGTMTFWCIDNPDTEVPVVVGLLDDGRMLLTFPQEAGPVLILGHRD